jgi:transcriptional regulator with XRE-family HTH domain
LPDVGSEFADYLRARRAAVRPEDVGFPADPRRRVAGLRREEVAELAGISPEYYVRLEQGHSYQLSEPVLKGLSRALLLDAEQTAYLYRLALPAPTSSGRRSAQPVSPLVERVLEQWSDVPLYVFDRNQDVVLANPLAAALLPEIAAPGTNLVLSTFAVPTTSRGLETWKAVARRTVAALRFQGDPGDPRFREVVAQLRNEDEDFRRIWNDHDARPLTTGVAPIVVDGFGFGEFPWQTLDVPGGYFMTVWIAPAGSFEWRAIEFLRSMTVTMDADASAVPRYREAG